jgi:hypothetical protein
VRDFVAKKKASKKKPVKKKKTRAKLLELDEVYRLVNRVQVSRKQVRFYLTKEDAQVTQNVLRDVDLEFKMREMKTKVKFTIFPPEEEVIDEDASEIDVDFFQDEVPERGSIF